MSYESCALCPSNTHKALFTLRLLPWLLQPFWPPPGTPAHSAQTSAAQIMPFSWHSSFSPSCEHSFSEWWAQAVWGIQVRFPVFWNQAWPKSLQDFAPAFSMCTHMTCFSLTIATTSSCATASSTQVGQEKLESGKGYLFHFQDPPAQITLGRQWLGARAYCPYFL